MTTPIASIDSQHEDMIHDCQFDYYSKKLATCSSDRTIKIFDVAGDVYHNCATLSGHEGPIWQIAWAHPKFGSLLASCSYDGSVIIHRESPQNVWVKAYEHKFHDSSVNSISWASHELGLVLACASSDGRVSILEQRNGAWLVKHFVNDALGCNSVSWAPFSASSSMKEDGEIVRRIVTGSCDNIVRMWRCVETSDGSTNGNWVEEAKVVLSPHSDWVRDVAWAPNSAMPYNIIASCSEDRTVYIWRQSEVLNGAWEPKLLWTFDAPVWRVSWSVTGNVLAVSTGDHKVSLWKQSVDESWVQISTVEDSSTQQK